MRYLRSILLLCGALWLVGTLTVAADTDKPKAKKPGETEIEQILAYLPVAVLEKNVDTIVYHLTDSVEVSIYGRKSKGRENIRDLLEIGLTRFIDVKLEMVVGDMLVGDTAAALSGYAKYTIIWPMGGETVRDGDFVSSWRLRGKLWKLHTLIVTPPKE